MYAAYEFIKFMTSHDANLAVAAGNTGYLPIRQSVAEDPAYEAYVADGHEYMRAGVEQSDRYFYEPRVLPMLPPPPAPSTAPSRP